MRVKFIIMKEKGHKKVLVVEGSTIIQKLLKKILLFENCQVTPAYDDKEGLDKFEQEDFDLIILDNSLPLVDGLSVTRKIRSGKTPKANVPIIGISGNAKNLPVSEFFQAGMNDYMQKPLDYDRLIKLVKKHITPT